MSKAFKLSMNEYLPSPLGASKANVIEHGEKTRREAKLEHGFQLKDLFELNGGEIESQDALDTNDRAFEFRPDGTFKIYLSSLRSGLSNNLIAAREFGHFVLHVPDFKRNHPDMTMVVPKTIPEANEDLIRCKWETIWFAAGFLMPEAEFVKAVDERGLEDASSLFAVTPDAARNRHDEIMNNIAVHDAAPTPA